MNFSYKKSGSILFGISEDNYSYSSFANIVISDDILHVTCFGLFFLGYKNNGKFIEEVWHWPKFKVEYYFTQGDNITFYKRRWLMSEGVEIKHSKKDYPPFLLFLSKDSDHLIESIKTCRWNVTDILKS